MESLLVIIIVGCALLYCLIGLKKIMTGQKQCGCSSNGGSCCSSDGGGCSSSGGGASSQCGSGGCSSSEFKCD